MARVLPLLALVVAGTLAAPSGDQDELGQLKEKVKVLQRAGEASEAELQRLRAEAFELESKKQSKVTDPAAFTVYRSGNINVSGGQKVPYNVVITDVGTSAPNFDINANEFRAPVPGIYVFHFTTGTSGTGTCRNELYRNNERLVTGFAPSGACGSNSATLVLAAGDSISTRPESSCTIHGDTRRYSTLTGYQIA